METKQPQWRCSIAGCDSNDIDSELTIYRGYMLCSPCFSTALEYPDDMPARKMYDFISTWAGEYGGSPEEYTEDDFRREQRAMKRHVAGDRRGMHAVFRAGTWMENV